MRYCSESFSTQIKNFFSSFSLSGSLRPITNITALSTVRVIKGYRDQTSLSCIPKERFKSISVKRQNIPVENVITDARIDVLICLFEAIPEIEIITDAINTTIGMAKFRNHLPLVMNSIYSKNNRIPMKSADRHVI